VANRRDNRRNRREQPPQNITGRVPPYSQEAETAVLGGILLNNQAFLMAKEFVKAEDFYVEANRRIFEGMEDLMGSGSPVDALTLGHALKDRGDLEKIGGAMALAGLTDAVATSANVDHYARIVKDKSDTRRIIYIAQEIAAAGFTQSYGTTDEYISKARSMIIEAAAKSVAGEGEAEHVAAGVKKLFQKMEEGEPVVEFLQFGFGGLRVRKKIPIVIGGRPSNMKSALAMNGAKNLCKQGAKGLVFNLEDSKESCWCRLMASESQVDLGSIEEPKRLQANNWPALVQAANDLSVLNLWCWDKTRVSSEWVHHKCAIHKERHGLDFVVLDYLQLMRDEGEGRYDRFTNSVEGLTEVAKELDLAMIILSQLKKVDLPPGVVPKPPNEGDLKETGALEQAAKIIYLVHYPGHYDKEGTDSNVDPHKLRVETAKDSNGPKGVRWLRAEPAKMWIGDVIHGDVDIREHY
jgi:replicative DNA helicase